MAVQKKIIELNKKDIIQLVCEKYNLNPEKAEVSVSPLRGDLREDEHPRIAVTTEIKIVK